jgi:oligoendopeptidase F
MKNTVKYGANTPRTAIPSQYKWKITDIYPQETAWKKACKELKAQLPSLQAFQGKLKKPTQLLAALKKCDQLAQEVEKIYAYARLQLDADNTSTHYQALAGQAENLLAAFNNTASFMEPDILALSAAQKKKILNTAAFKDYRFNLENLFRKAAHVLNPEQEALLAHSMLATGTGAAAFRALVSADMHFPAAKDSKGKNHLVSEGTYLSQMTSSDRVLRKNAFQTLMNTYHTYQNTFAATLTGACRSSYFYATMHKYQDTIAASLDEDNIPVKLYDNLINVAHKHFAPLHQYINLKKQTLKLTQLHPYDLYMPLTKAPSTYAFSFDDACAFIIKALAPLGKDYAAALKHAFASHWIDIYENKGKRSGAYSWGLYNVHPYVLMSYQPNYRSMSTIAHEIGHSLHSYFTNKTQPYATSDYTIFCAEIASTTNEILLAEYALAQGNKQEKIYLLNQMLENIRTTVYRQIQFAEFEKYIHGKITNGESLQAQDLNAYWVKSNETYYGKSFTVDKELEAEWSRIPHFYTPIYVYKYATGYAAATNFAHAILSGKKDAVTKYLAFLKAGASDYPLNILKKSGVDFTTVKPLEITLQVFEEKQKELTALLKK